MPLDPKAARRSKRASRNLPVMVLALMAAGAVVFPIALAVAAIAGIITA